MPKNELAKIAVFVPETHADSIRKALAHAGCGNIGNYDSCSFTTSGEGRFRPLDGASPTIGEIGKIEIVNEVKIEAILPIEEIQSTIEVIKEVHPYDEPAIDVYPLMNHQFDI